MNYPNDPVTSSVNKGSVLTLLSDHIGEAKGINARCVVETILNGESYPATERHLRDIIMELRLEGYHICGHPSTGYYMAESEEELLRTCVFLFKRAKKTLDQIARMRNTSLPDLCGQLRLPIELLDNEKNS